jgi:hypothetical protein
MGSVGVGIAFSTRVVIHVDRTALDVRTDGDLALSQPEDPHTELDGKSEKEPREDETQEASDGDADDDRDEIENDEDADRDELLIERHHGYVGRYSDEPFIGCGPGSSTGPH